MRVLKKSKDMKFGEGQLPDYRPIQFADNDGGEFLFPKPRAVQQQAAWSESPVPGTVAGARRQ
jgi:hypothetical protein